MILERLQDTQAFLLLYFVIRFNCSPFCWLYKYDDKTSESSLCLNTAEQFECNYSARPRESESKHFKRQRVQSAEVRYTVPQPCKSLLFPLHKSIRRTASPSYERRTLGSLWLWLWSMTTEKVENEKQSERDVCVWWRPLCAFVLAGSDFSFSDIFITLQQEDLSQVSTQMCSGAGTKHKEQTHGLLEDIIHDIFAFKSLKTTRLLSFFRVVCFQHAFLKSTASFILSFSIITSRGNIR